MMRLQVHYNFLLSHMTGGM